MKQTVLLFILALLPIIANADAVEIDGIWYNLVNISKVKTAEVTKNPNISYYSGSYSSEIDIPAKVTYEGTEFDVTSIGAGAFSYCHNAITSITIPNSVISIGSNAFYRCEGLNSIAIPYSVTSIGSNAFGDCSGLTSVHITDIEAWCNIKFDSNPLSYAHKLFLNDSELKDLVIPNSVTSIGDRAFENCTGLTSVTIPDGVMSIGNYAFQNCTGLNSITIANSVKSIGDHAFENCTGLTSITIPNNVTSIGADAFGRCGLSSIIVEEGNPKYDSRNNCNAIIETEKNMLILGCKVSTIPSSITIIGVGAFSWCTGLTSITIPNSVTSIGVGAFSYCSGLTSITIPNEVVSIGNSAFAECPELIEVTCLAVNVPNTYWDTFYSSYIEYATLHVPASAIDDYKSTEPWSNFKEIVAVDGSEIPKTPKCATPTITYKNGKINFSCETEGVEYVSTISAGDTKSYFAGEITLTNKYTVSVYATKDGYDKSDTATLDIIGSVGTFGDLNEDGEVNVADHVELSKIILNKSK